MTALKDQSLRKKLRLIAMSSVMIAVVLTGFSSLFISQHLQQRIIHENINTFGQMIAENCIVPLSFRLSEDANDVLMSLKTKPSIVAAYLNDEAGALFAKYERNQAPGMENRGFDKVIASSLETVIDIQHRGVKVGQLVIYDDLSELSQTIQWGTVGLFYMMAIALAIAYFIAARLQDFIIEPIKELVKISKSISSQEAYGLRAKKYANDELGKLTDAFNTMLEQIQKRDKSIRESEASQRVIAEHAPEAIVILDVESLRFVYANENAIKLYGIDKASLFQLTPYDVSPEYQPDGRLSVDLARVYIRAANEGQTPVFEWLHLNAQQTPIACEVRLVKLPESGHSRIRGTVTDITERKLAEMELKRLRNFLKNIVDSMPSVLVGVDKSGLVTQWNREAEKVTGINAENAEGFHLTEVYPQFKASIDKIRQAIELRRPWVDHRVTSEIDGKIHYNDITVFPLVTNGVEGAVVRVDDITDRIRIEEMVVQSEKMLSVGGLAAGMAHELNNPLAGIVQNLQVIQNRFSPELAKNNQVAEGLGISMQLIEQYMTQRGILEMIQAIMDSGLRASKIIDNMLSFSRKSSGTKNFSDLTELLDKAVDLALTEFDLGKHFDFRHIKINRYYEDTLQLVLCDENQIQQVFLNILKNSAQAMSQESAEVASKELTLRVLNEMEYVWVEIEDNGPGMDEETRKRVFEPFFTTKPSGVDTGLGLSVSYFIITENHQGLMRVDSNLGSGSRFIIKLPIHPKTVANDGS